MPGESTTKIKDLLAAKVAQAREGDFLALLDLKPDADEKQIKDAYFRLARLVHPDSLRKQSLADRKDDAAYIFERCTEAYHVLLDPQKRNAWLAAREQAAGPSPEVKSRATEEQAKIALHRGKMFLNRKAFGQAEECFQEYVLLKPDTALGHLLLGWSLFQNQAKELGKRLEDARGAFQKAIKLDEASADAHYYLGLYWKEKGNFEQMSKCIEKALEFDKNHVAAQREKRLVDMRSKQAPKQQSVGDFLKDFFGKLGKKG